MKDDTSQIVTTGCSVLSASDTIDNYTGNIHRKYVFNGGRWLLSQTSSRTYDYDVSGYNCIDVSTLNSNAIFEPFIYGLGFCLFIVSVVLVFKSVKGLFYAV